MTQIINNGYLILTAAAFSNPHVEKYIKTKIDLLTQKRVAIITTASAGKETNKYSMLAMEAYLKIGVDSATFVDIEKEPNFDFTKIDIIHICGGNTFTLLHFARLAKLDLSIKNILSRKGLCIGVSAGSLILGPSVKIASEIRPDKNEIGEINYTGLNLTDCIIFPHYEESAEKEIVNFEEKNNVKIQRVRNDQAIVVNNNKFVYIQ